MNPLTVPLVVLVEGTNPTHGAHNTSVSQVQGFEESYHTTKYIRGQNRIVEDTTPVQGEANAKVDTLMVTNQNCGR